MQKKPVNLKKILYWVAISILSLVILVCGAFIVSKLVTDAQDKQDYADLASKKEESPTDSTRPPIPTGTQPTEPSETTEPTVATEPSEPSEPEVMVPSETTPSEPVLSEPTTVPEPTEPSATTEPTQPTEPKILSQFQALHAINKDMVGWIEIPGTEINYPVVQSPYEANFYLRKNFYKEKATCGTIYVREACNVFAPSDNVTIYGHNMRNGTMFADLHLYEEKSFWWDNRYIFFDTLYEYHTYEIFAIFISTADLDVGFKYHIFDDARNQQEYDEFVAKCKELSLYDTGITPEYGEKLITLSTCDKSIDDGRFVVVARRVV